MTTTAATRATRAARAYARVAEAILYVVSPVRMWVEAYGTYGVGIADPQWPGARWVAYLGPPLWVPGSLLLITVLPAVYPDGRLPGPRWRLPVAAAVVGIALTTLLMLGAYHDVAPGPPPVRLDLAGPAEVVVGV